MDGARYRKIFRDIVRGFSDTEVQGQKLYIKHLSSLDQVDIDEVRDFYYQKALERGIPKSSEILEKLISDGTWNQSQDNEINRLNNFIEQLKKNKTQIVLKSKLDKQNKQIEETQKKINALESKKSALIGINAETYSEKRSNDYYIIKSFYEDSELNKPVFPDEDDFNNLYSEDVVNFIKQYNSSFEMFEEIKIQEMILQDFYYIYFPFSDDTVGFFGSPVCQLTYNQLKLIVYTKIFKNIFERNVNIPESIKKDPKALLDYGNISDEAKSKMQEQISEDKAGSTLFGATEEDYEYAGLQKPSDQVGVSLTKAAQKKGGSLNMQDLMELSGLKSK